VVKKKVLGEELNAEEIDILKAQGWENIPTEEHVGWNNMAFEEHLKMLRDLFDNPHIGELSLINPEAYIKTETGREVGRTQRIIRSKHALVIVEGKYLAGNFRKYADYTVRLDAPADQIRLQFIKERANYLPGHELEKLLRWYDSFTWPSWETYKAKVDVDKVINIKPLVAGMAVGANAAMLVEEGEIPQTILLKELIRKIIVQNDLFYKIDFSLVNSSRVLFKDSERSHGQKMRLLTILAELIAYKFHPNMKGKIRINVQDNKIYITKDCRIDWEEIKNKYDELLGEENLYAFHKEDGSVGELAHKTSIPDLLISLGVFVPATQKEIDDLFATPEGRNILFFSRRGISFAQDKNSAGLYLAQIASKEIGAEIRVHDSGEESGEVSFEITISKDSGFTLIDKAMQAAVAPAFTSNQQGAKTNIVAFFPNLANRGSFGNIDRTVFDNGSEAVKQLYFEAAGSLGYLKDGKPDPTQIFEEEVSKEELDLKMKFLQTMLLVHSLALNKYFQEQAQKEKKPIQIQAYTAESFGVITAAVASGALSLKDALRIADDVLAGLAMSKNDTEYYAIQLVGENIRPMIKNYEFSRHDTIGSLDQYDIYVRAADLEGFLSDMRTNNPTVTVTNRGKIRTSFLFSVAHTKGLHHARLFAERSIEANGIHFKDPQVPMISNNDTGILTTAEQVKNAVLDIYDEPMISDKTIDMTLGMKPDLIVEMGLGKRTGEWIETKKLLVPFFQFSGGANNEQIVFKAIDALTTDRDLAGTAKHTGGINFNADKINLQIQNSGGSIKFKLDPAMLRQLQNAPGFVPVIINVRPLTSLNVFLGINPVKVSKESP
jgi:hypothetical protein